MTTKSKTDPNWRGDQQPIWRERPYCDEGTEFDLRWGFTASEEFLLARVPGIISLERGVDAVDSAVAGSIP